MIPALVLDGDTPAALAVVRSLGRRGVPCVVGTPEGAAPLAGHSRYAAETWTYPDPARHRSAFLAALTARLARAPCAALIPVTDWTLLPIVDDRDRLSGSTELLIPPTKALAVTLSKTRTAALAAACKIPTPPGLALAADTPAPDLSAWSPGLIKPDQSKRWAGDLGQHREVIPFQTPAEGARAWARLAPLGPGQVQAKVPGEGVGVSLFATAGKLQFAFQYKRLHEVPLMGGGSSLRISEALDPSFAEDAARLVRALAWDGVAMLEYKRALDGRRWLIEINGRFWGSLPLAVAAGADFPWAWFAHRTGHPWRPPSPRIGLRVRALERDLEWFKAAARALPPARIGKAALELLSPAGRTDTLSLSDPRPGLTTLTHLAGDLLGLPLRRARRHRARRAALALRRDPAAQATLLAGVDRVVFVCEGNIIRSAYAEALARALAPHRPWASVGLGAWPGRPAHPEACALGAAQGLDLTGHRATPALHCPPRPGDLWLCMTHSQTERLTALHPAVPLKTALLGSFGQGPLEIPDPDGHPSDAFPPVLEAVAACVRALGAALPRGA